MNEVGRLGPPPPAMLEGASLFLDFDGTMVSLADTPDAVEVSPATRQLLSALDIKLQGRLAIVSGRDVETLRDQFGLSELSIAGSHGAEIGLKGEPVSAPPRAEALSIAYEKLLEFAASHDGVVVENKPLGIGLHYRLASDKVEPCQTIAEKLVDELGLSLQHGKMMFELRGETADKGIAISSLMTRDVFAGRKPVFIGDDVTDENGFRAVVALGGTGIKVGTEGQTHAGHALEDVKAVHAFLKQFIQMEVD